MKGKMRIVVDSSYGLRTAGRQLMDAPKSDWVVMSKVCPSLLWANILQSLKNFHPPKNAAESGHNNTMRSRVSELQCPTTSKCCWRENGNHSWERELGLGL